MTKSGCPVCGAAPSVDYRPFCSKRCADVDLHRWLTGNYSISGPSSDEEDEGLTRKTEE